MDIYRQREKGEYTGRQMKWFQMNTMHIYWDTYDIYDLT